MHNENRQSGLSELPARVVVLKILAQRTGAVSRKEIHAILRSQWLDAECDAPSVNLANVAIRTALAAGHVYFNHRATSNFHRHKDLLALTDQGRAFLKSGDYSPKQGEKKLTHISMMQDWESRRIEALSFSARWWPPVVNSQRTPNPVHQQIQAAM